MEENVISLALEISLSALVDDRFPVSGYFIGPRDTPFSIEFCGGPHVANTRDLASVRDPDGSDRKGVFKILKEEASAAGVRRIKAVLE